ncbi:MAG: hypothetical protein DWQ05_02290 [Calditrichaeota bacterium]|nr:MAG: hypothetical protein DWQ05_02290 [Calditrichota bacterium]
MKKITSSNLKYILQSLISLVLLLSAAGKITSIEATARSMAELFYLPAETAHIFVFGVVLLEIFFVFLVWIKPHKFLVILPIIFLIITGYSQFRNLDCGCFGTLPFFSQFPLWGHYLLVAGMLVGLIFLTSKKKDTVASAVISICLFLCAGFSLFFPDSPVVITHSAKFEIVQFNQVYQDYLNENTLLVDARSDIQFSYGTIGDAINIPHDIALLDSLVDLWNLRQQNLIIFCSGIHCDKADILATRLEKAGCENIKIYAGGWDDWVEKEVFIED